jgi:hypothetical protein
MWGRYVDDVVATIDDAIRAGTYRPDGTNRVSPVTLLWAAGAVAAAVVVWPMIQGKGRRRR